MASRKQFIITERNDFNPAFVYEIMKNLLLTISTIGIVLASCSPVTSYPSTTPKVITDTHSKLEVITSKNINELEEINRLGKGYVNGANISPNGKQIAVYTSTGIYFYDTSSFQETKLETPQEIPFRKWPHTGSVQYRPDGKILAFGVNDIHFWNFSDNKFETDLINHFPNAQIIDMQYSPDGNYIVLKSYVSLYSLCEGTGINLALYEIKSNNMLYNVSFCRTVSVDYAFTKNDKTYIFFNAVAFVPVPYKILVIKTSTGELLEETSYPLEDMETKRLYGISLDETKSAFMNFYGSSHLTQLTDTEFTRPSVGLANQAVRFTPNKNRMWAYKGTYDDFQYENGALELQDSTGKVLCPFEDTTHFSMNFSDDGNKMTIIASPSQIQLWDISTCSITKTFEFPSPENRIFFSPDGRYLSATDSWAIYLWDTESGSYKYTTPVHSGLGNGPPFAFNHNNTSLITLREGEKRTDYKFVEIDLPTGKDNIVFGTSSFLTESITSSNNENFSTITQYSSLGHFEIWDLSTKQVTAKFSAEKINASYSPNKSKAALLLSGNVNNVVVVNLNTGEVLSKFNFPEVMSIDFLSENQLLAGIYNPVSETLSAIKMDLDGNTQDELNSVVGICKSRKFTVRKRFLIYVCNNNQIQLLNAETNEIKELLGHRKTTTTGYQFTQAISSPNEDILASWSVIEDYSSQRILSEIRIWDTQSGELISEIQSDQKIIDLSFSPDGRRLAYLSEDSTIHILGIPKDKNENQ